MGKLSGLFRGDRVIWIVFFALCIISIVEVFSALSTLTYKDGDFIRPILRHFAFLVVGLLLVLVVHRIPCRYFKILMPLGLLFSFVTVAFRRRHNFFRRKNTSNSFALRCFNAQGSRARKQNVGIHIYHISNTASFRDGTQQVIKKTPNRKTAPMGIIARRYQRKKLIMQNLLYTLSNIFLAIIRSSSISFRFSCPKLRKPG